jgi:hypothetical protein
MNMSASLNRIIFLLLSIALAGCARNKATSEGGVDGSGGDVIGTPYEDFKTMVSDLPYLLDSSLIRLQLLRDNGDLTDSNLLELLENKPGLPSVRDHLRAVSINVKKELCSANTGHTDGAANLSENSICLSYSSFRKMSKQEATSQLTSLAFHEFAHLRGANELEAIAFQKALIEPSSRWISFSPSFSTPAFEANHSLNRSLLTETLLEIYKGLIVSDTEAACTNESSLDVSWLRVATELPQFPFSSMQTFVDQIRQGRETFKRLCSAKTNPLAQIKETRAEMKELLELTLLKSRYLRKLVNPHCDDSRFVGENDFCHDPVLQIQTSALIDQEKSITKFTERPLPLMESQVQCELKNDLGRKLGFLKKSSQTNQWIYAPSKEEPAFQISTERSLYFKGDILDWGIYLELKTLQENFKLKNVRTSHGFKTFLSFSTWLSRNNRETTQISFEVTNDEDGTEKSIGIYTIDCKIN